MPAKRPKARPRSAVIVVNRPKHPAKRRHYSRSNPPALSGMGALDRVISGVVGGLIILGTEVGTRLIRGRVFGMPAGTMLAGVTEVAVSTTAGLAAAHFVGEQTGQRIIDAGFASVMRATAKQLKAPIVADVLSDDTRRQNFVVRGGRVFPAGRPPVSGYVRGRMDGYVPGARRAPGVDRLGGYVRGTEAAAVTQVNV
jgi:hypothetical protein